VLDALISTMLTVIIGMTRDERQACEVVAEASQNLLSKQKAVARTEASDQLVGGCGTRDPRCGGVAAAKCLSHGRFWRVESTSNRYRSESRLWAAVQPPATDDYSLVFN
jgi:hypothetical protein